MKAPKDNLISKFPGDRGLAENFSSEILKIKLATDNLENLIKENFTGEDALRLYKVIAESYSIIYTGLTMPIAAKFPELED